ncbi:MAG: hypothetical protein WKG00_20400 [Polyangiaceae bacterium]
MTSSPQPDEAAEGETRTRRTNRAGKKSWVPARVPPALHGVIYGED